MTYKWILDGLDCAHCASKIESAVSTLPDVESVELNFMQKTLYFKSGEDKVAEIRKTILAIEPDIIIKTEPDDENNVSPHFAIICIIIASILFSCSYFLPYKNLLLFIAYIIVGAGVLIHAFKNIIHGKVFDENFLMCVATIGAIAIGELHEAVGVMLFYQIGELFQSLAVNRSRRSIRELLDIRPDFANIKNSDGITRISPADVKIGDIIVINPGERIPLDSIVIDGNSQVDTSAITGEPIPRIIKSGDAVLSGCVNLTGVLHAKATQTFAKSTASKILELVEHATAKKSQPENFITKFARIYTPAVIFSALALAIFPPLFGADFKTWLYRALMFLVISCPCALVVSVPLSFFAGIGRASKNGILIKGSNYLDVLSRIKTVVFDKTGTLTHGVFSVQEIISDNPRLLEITALAESYSPHPIAVSIREAYSNKLDTTRVSDVYEIPGRGVSAKVDNMQVLAGNSALLEENGVVHSIPSQDGTIVSVAIDGKYAGCIKIADKIKPDAKAAVSALRACGVENIVMLSGDRRQSAEACAKSLGIETFFSELLPADKLSHLENLLQNGTLAFVGDGMNDAPSLARADIGIAMGALGTDAAIEAADVVLMNDELLSLPKAINISKKTRNIVIQNIIFILVIKILFLLLGALGMANMWTAVFADVGVSVIAILNAMRAM